MTIDQRWLETITEAITDIDIIGTGLAHTNAYSEEEQQEVLEIVSECTDKLQVIHNRIRERIEEPLKEEDIPF